MSHMWKQCALLALLLSGCLSARQKAVAVQLPDEPEIALDPAPEIDIVCGVPAIDPNKACCWVTRTMQ